MGWDDIVSMPTANFRGELRALVDKEYEYSLRGEVYASSSSGAAEPSSKIRSKICQWMYECVDYFLFDREVVHLSMHYFDRYYLIASREHGARPSTTVCHLLALSCLHLACKLHGGPSPSVATSSDDALTRVSTRARLRLRDLCHISCGGFSQETLQGMELSLLSTLKWKLHPPMPADFLIRFAKVLSQVLNDDPHRQPDFDCGSSAYELARYQIELAAYSTELCNRFRPSTVALAAILNAMESNFVRTIQPMIPSYLRSDFLMRVKSMGADFFEFDMRGEEMVEARTNLKNLCSPTVALPSQIVDDPSSTPSGDSAFQPIDEDTNTIEFELPQIAELTGSTTSPVSVSAVVHF